MRPIFSDGLPLRAFFFKKVPPASSERKRLGLLNARIEQDGCQDVSAIILEEIAWKEFLSILGY